MTPKAALIAGLFVAACAFAACGEQGQKYVMDPTTTTTGQGQGGGGEGGGEEAVCPHVGPPLIDPASFPPCTNCDAGEAACVPKVLLPPEKLSSFSDCDADNVCVPFIIIETSGNFIPATCDSVFGAEGRCLNKCLPSVAPKVETLPQSDCSNAEVCVPCYDPFTQEPTGACEQSCDPGPVEPPVELQTCCSGIGVCLPTEAVGDSADKLGQDVCAQDGGEWLCVPSALLEPDYVPLSCIDEFIFGDEPGVCVAECIPAVQGLLQDFTLDQQGCPEKHLCAPCNNPITGSPTGACE
ncbi:MAG: hypothetical protein JRI23_36105 [Deltaproteobacteria bacterium]|jgi:hypothetical protein|nr:hypothetical protein [Deltaproteobacteria bacterium]MBW2537773.1 hypothetical protein [Deltaproteobacteria bacterium]